MRQWFRRPAGAPAVRFCVGLCVLVASGGAFGRAQRAPSVDDVRSTLDRGAYEEAERVAVDVCARVNEQYGAESLESAQAQDLLVEALVKNGHAGADSTLDLATDVIELKQRLRGPDNLGTALSLHNLGDVRRSVGLATAASLTSGVVHPARALPASDRCRRQLMAGTCRSTRAWRTHDKRLRRRGDSKPGRSNPRPLAHA